MSITLNKAAQPSWFDDPRVPLSPAERLAALELAITLIPSSSSDACVGATAGGTVVLVTGANRRWQADVAGVGQFEFSCEKGPEQPVRDLRWTSPVPAQVSFSRVAIRALDSSEAAVRAALARLEDELVHRTNVCGYAAADVEVIHAPGQGAGGRYHVVVPDAANGTAARVVITAEAFTAPSNEAQRVFVAAWNVDGVWRPFDAGEHANTQLDTLCADDVVRHALATARIVTVGDLALFSPQMLANASATSVPALDPLVAALDNLGLAWRDAR